MLTILRQEFHTALCVGALLLSASVLADGQGGLPAVPSSGGSGLPATIIPATPARPVTPGTTINRATPGSALTSPVSPNPSGGLYRIDSGHEGTPAPNTAATTASTVSAPFTVADIRTLMQKLQIPDDVAKKVLDLVQKDVPDDLRNAFGDLLTRAVNSPDPQVKQLAKSLVDLVEKGKGGKTPVSFLDVKNALEVMNKISEKAKHGMGRILDLVLKGGFPKGKWPQHVLKELKEMPLLSKALLFRKDAACGLPAAVSAGLWSGLVRQTAIALGSMGTVVAAAATAGNYDQQINDAKIDDSNVRPSQENMKMAEAYLNRRIEESKKETDAADAAAPTK